jgi:hypothetical protein
MTSDLFNLLLVPPTLSGVLGRADLREIHARPTPLVARRLYCMRGVENTMVFSCNACVITSSVVSAVHHVDAQSGFFFLLNSFLSSKARASIYNAMPALSRPKLLL